MWVMLGNAFLSIVDKDCLYHELLVRARRPGDIEKYFPEAKVTKTTDADYLFRAVVSRAKVRAMLAEIVMNIDYGNFKDTVADKPLHDAYLRVWTTMAEVQPTPPYSGLRAKKGKRRAGVEVIDNEAAPELAEAIGKVLEIIDGCPMQFCVDVLLTCLSRAIGRVIADNTPPNQDVELDVGRMVDDYAGMLKLTIMAEVGQRRGEPS